MSMPKVKHPDEWGTRLMFRQVFGNTTKADRRRFHATRHGEKGFLRRKFDETPRAKTSRRCGTPIRRETAQKQTAA